MLFGFGGAVLLYRAIPTQAAFGIWVLFLSIVSVIEVGRIGLLPLSKAKKQDALQPLPLCLTGY